MKRNKFIKNQPGPKGHWLKCPKCGFEYRRQEKSSECMMCLFKDMILKSYHQSMEDLVRSHTINQGQVQSVDINPDGFLSVNATIVPVIPAESIRISGIIEA